MVILCQACINPCGHLPLIICLPVLLSVLLSLALSLSPSLSLRFSCWRLACPDACSWIPSAIDCTTFRYMYPFLAEEDEVVFVLHWDAEIGTTQDIWLALWVQDIRTGEYAFVVYFDEVSIRRQLRRPRSSMLCLVPIPAIPVAYKPSHLSTLCIPNLVETQHSPARVCIIRTYA